MGHRTPTIEDERVRIGDTDTKPGFLDEKLIAGANITLTPVNVGGVDKISIASTGGSAGTGDVVGPAGATDNAVARFDTATGKLIQNSTAILEDSGTLSVNTIKLSATPTIGAPIIGEIYINTAEGGLPEVKINAASSLTIGAELYTRVVNKTGVTILDGKVVYINGAQGNRPTIALAKADALATCMLIGVVTADIADNAEGFVTIVGDLHGFNTSVYGTGDTLYLSPTTAGEVTNVSPSSPYYKVIVGKTLNSTINGLLNVKPSEPIALNTALGTDDVTPSQGAVKTYADVIKQSVTDLNDSGFVSWGGSGAYYSIIGSGASAVLRLLRPGTGRINGTLVSWSAPQDTAAFADNSGSVVYINSSGLIQTSTTYVADVITLFEVLDDGTNHTVVRENHPYGFDSQVSQWIHNSIGTNISATPGTSVVGANITRVTTGTGSATTDREIKIVGAAVLNDHGLYTTIPDSAGAGVTFNTYYTNGAGKWIRYAQQTQFPMFYNNAGTATAISSGRSGIYTLYVSKDDLNSSTPTYFAVMHTADYANTTQASAVLSGGTNAQATNELAGLELAQLGTIIVSNNATSGFVEIVNISKKVIGSFGSTGTTLPGGTSGAIQYNSSGVFGGATVNGLVKSDGTNAPTAAVSDTDFAAPPTAVLPYSKDVYVNAATTANITLSAPQTVDGVALVAGNYCLVKNQSTASGNGVYVVNAGAWTRAPEYDTNTEMYQRDIFVQAGTTNSNTWWLCATRPITVGTTSLVFAQIPDGVGTGATQAAAGNHTHTSFSNLSLGGTTTIGLNNPLRMEGSQLVRIITRTATGSTGTGNNTIQFSGSTASQIETFPALSTFTNGTGYVYHYFNDATVDWTIRPTSPTTINGSLSDITLKPGQAITLRQTAADAVVIAAAGNNKFVQVATNSYTPAAAGTSAIDINQTNTHFVQFPAGNISLTLTGGATGKKFLVRLKQDSVGSRTISSWFSGITISWSGGSAPTLTTAANKTDIVGFIMTSATTMDGMVVSANI